MSFIKSVIIFLLLILSCSDDAVSPYSSNDVEPERKKIKSVTISSTDYNMKSIEPYYYAEYSEDGKKIIKEYYDNCKISSTSENGIERVEFTDSVFSFSTYDSLDYIIETYVHNNDSIIVTKEQLNDSVFIVKATFDTLEVSRTILERISNNLSNEYILNETITKNEFKYSPISSEYDEYGRLVSYYNNSSLKTQLYSSSDTIYQERSIKRNWNTNEFDTTLDYTYSINGKNLYYINDDNMFQKYTRNGDTLLCSILEFATDSADTTFTLLFDENGKTYREVYGSRGYKEYNKFGLLQRDSLWNGETGYDITYNRFGFIMSHTKFRYQDSILTTTVYNSSNVTSDSTVMGYYYTTKWADTSYISKVDSLEFKIIGDKFYYKDSLLVEYFADTFIDYTVPIFNDVYFIGRKDSIFIQLDTTAFDHSNNSYSSNASNNIYNYFNTVFFNPKSKNYFSYTSNNMQSTSITSAFLLSDFEGKLFNYQLSNWFYLTSKEENLIEEMTEYLAYNRITIFERYDEAFFYKNNYPKTYRTGGSDNILHIEYEFYE